MDAFAVAPRPLPLPQQRLGVVEGKKATPTKDRNATKMTDNAILIKAVCILITGGGGMILPTE